MGDAPRLTDERLDDIVRLSRHISTWEVRSIAIELQERRAQSEGQAKVVEADAQFLLDRLSELEIPEELARDWMGHVEPAIERLSAALIPIGDSSGEGGGR